MCQVMAKYLIYQTGVDVGYERRRRHIYLFMQGGQYETMIDQFNANSPFAAKTRDRL